jgi:N-acetylneuraminic acid mutarotase
VVVLFLTTRQAIMSIGGMARVTPSRLLLLLALLALLGLSFEAGRRYPFEFLGRFGPEQPVAATSSVWTRVGEVPQTHYESASAVWRDRLYVFGGFWNFALQTSAQVHVFDPESETWSRAADMPHPATHRNAVLVGDTIWLAGGFAGDHPGPSTDRVLRYVPATDSWLEGPALPEVRGAGALVADGRRLHYYGGYGGDKVPRTDHWMLDLDAWQAGDASWEPRAPLPTPRGHVTGASVSGYIYAISGALPHDPFSADLMDVYRYDPRTDAWSDAASLPFPLSHNEPGTFVRDGQIWMVGGRSKGRSLAAWDIMIYDPPADLWLRWRSLPQPLLAPAAAAIGDELFVAGGADMEINPETVTGVWRASLKPGWWGSTPIPEPVEEVAAGIVGNRLVVVGGGSSSTQIFDVSGSYWMAEMRRTAPRPLVGHGHAAEVLGDSLYLLGGIDAGAGRMQVYDVRSNVWTVGPELPFQAGGSASALIDGKIYVGGGTDGSSVLAEAAVYDPATETWSSIAPMPEPTSHAASGTDGARWYVFGGRGPADADGVAHALADVQVYDPATDTWTTSGSGPDAPSPLPVGREGMGGAPFVDGRFYVIGGRGANGPGADVYDRVDVYDAETNVWTDGPPLATARHGIFPVLVGTRRLVVAGGANRAGAATGALEILDISP